MDHDGFGKHKTSAPGAPRLLMRTDVVIVGGGASGVLVAAHLLRAPGQLGVTIVEPAEDIGRGLAYGTDDPAHLLNTRAGNMSAFEDDPQHFWRWLEESGNAARFQLAGPFSFAPRLCYRDYLRDLVRHWLPETGDGRLRVVRDTCIDLAETPSGVVASFASGTSLAATAAVLAIGHASGGGHAPYAPPSLSNDAPPIGPDEDILILGCGLSMIDNLAALRRRGHRGRITALSRRGLLPHVHAPTTPFQLDAADVPFGTGPAYFLRWLRRTIRWAAEDQGRDWRDVIDALRPHTSGLWSAMPPGGRARFLRHGRTLWDIHRHRMPPQLAAQVEAAVADGGLRILAGRIVEETLEAGRHRVTVRHRAGPAETLVVDRILDCTGLLKRPEADGTGLLRALLASGTAREDALGIGVEVADDCALVGRSGARSERIRAVGPPTRSRFWEITAIPDIRAQARRVAASVAQASTVDSQPV